MARANQKKEQPKFLAGWKEIASYLGHGVRTVQRYEREMGLPVRRPSGKNRAAVVATKAELDAWVAASPIRETFHLSQPKTKMDDGAFALNFVNRIAEMRRLRDQMIELRAELKNTVDALRGSIQNVHVEMNNMGRSKSFSVADFDFDNRAVSDNVGTQALRKTN
jgi:hypothetical protein